jgi:phosphoribosylglycinamide formyltransferase-1
VAAGSERQVTMIVIGILASHEGTTCQAVLDACKADLLPASIGIVISNNRDSGALRRAQAAGVQIAHLSGQTHPNPESLDAAICLSLQVHKIDVVLLAGYMKKLGPRTLGAFRNRILNTHPALLPKYGGKGMYGLRVHQAVLDACDSVTGVSIHLVDEEYDKGSIIAQCSIPVLSGDTPETLATRVQQHERRLVVEVLTGIAKGTVQLADFGR